jgi:phosphoglucomutase/phosphomannomutase
MCPGPTGQARIRQIISAFRTSPPSKTAECVWESVRDFKQHEVRVLPSNNVDSPLPKPSGDLLIFQGRTPTCQVTVAMRPSGTEPKIKFYYFLRCAIDDLANANSVAGSTLEAIKTELDRWMNAVT